ncbi:hypothetical protein M409DRAFT_70407 [Zasmidium cellare ATCC 36951]|uniref:Peptide hydrolase n=1 Tax=Zasmidium cellare ATCC 36951 TaxID=1080233 RepID=A0A6A6C3X0_ZASCE|nr:uncharacterized protein M409DRAFT_70407 [Zasmidium cellare ATCC 36951]KAF2160439.1 hypothetical protein M409DRAFT_70407 [Zasmidium cellare ATCC 36951]
MARTRSLNPFLFFPAQVTILTSIVYIVLFAVVIWVAETVPAAPSNKTPVAGVNLTEAWLDLENITNGLYHPWGSRANEQVREYLLKKIEEIGERNEVERKTIYAANGTFTSETEGVKALNIFASDSSNFTGSDGWTKRPTTLYGESENILVYIRGQEDAEGDWWNTTVPYRGSSGVLVNAHFDSVPSGLGATDDGVGVVTILQLISHFTQRGNQPKRGIVALLNNGEENGLYGAKSYVRHPLSQFPHTFLNLEGAGAGGRAILFRSTDAEVTSFYAKSPYPSGNIISGDGFKRGFVRSGTDYTPFTEELGMRGLDVAFYKPRSRYHTDEDDVRNTSPDSVWHMLSSALATMQALTSYDGKEFEGTPDKRGRLVTGTGSDAVWFDVFGLGFAVAKLSTLFALSVTLLVAGPVILIILEVLIRKSDKWYPFAGKRYLRSSDDDEAVRLHGRRGFFRFLMAFVLATAVTVLLGYLLAKVNPLIVYSSEYAVLAMYGSAWFAVAWFVLKGASSIRPTALQRMFVLIWLYVLSWVLLVLTTVGENNLHLGSGYFFVIYNASVFVALLISYLELFVLPNVQKYVEHVLGVQGDAASTRPGSRSSRNLLDQGDNANDDGEATERTSLLRGRTNRTNQNTFTGVSRRRADRDEVPDDVDDPYLSKHYIDEQAWSSSLPQWTWLLQLIFLAPINIIIVGQILLLLTASINQTPADGNAVLPVYLLTAVLTVLLLLPLTPFLHRITFHVPTFLFLIFLGCLIYNLVAFPFSREARLKYFFVQEMDLDSGVNNVTLLGVDGFLQDIIEEFPSAAAQKLNCAETAVANRNGLAECSWHGLPPNVVPRKYNGLPSNSTHKDWIHFNVTKHGNSASFSLQGQKTKICRLYFDDPVSSVAVEGGASDDRQPNVPEGGSNQVHLFSRTWDKTFRVNVTWDEAQAKGQTGRVACFWSDANQPGTIPAFDEVRRFEPVWSAVTKQEDGLFEGWKAFSI